MQKYKFVIFDLDRTLWDFETNSKITLNEIYQNFKLFEYFSGFDTFFETYHAINEKLWELYRNGKIKKQNLRNDRFLLTLKTVNVENKKLTQKIGDYYINESPLKTKLFPFTNEILKYLKEKHYNISILTNGFKEVQYKKLKNCKIYHFFDNIFCSEDIGYQKPNPATFKYTLKHLKALPQNTIMIGDDIISDIEGAHKLGIDTIFFNPKKQKQNYPKYQIHSLLEIKNIL
jgi:putative hydrolase of the HAD superfamily